MASPVDYTAIFSAAGSVVAGAAAYIAVRKQNRKDRADDERDRDLTDVASWKGLNDALDREIKRLHEEMDRQREDYERQLREQEERHERERALDRKRIAELERDVESLQRLLRGGGNSPA